MSMSAPSARLAAMRSLKAIERIADSTERSSGCSVTAATAPWTTIVTTTKVQIYTLSGPLEGAPIIGPDPQSV